jgi:hypothetical protein
MPLLAASLVACGSDDDKNAEPGAEQPHAYVVSREVTTGSGTSETAITVLADTEKQTIDDATGITVPGYSQAFTELGYVFATNNEDVSLTRYEVSSTNELVNPQVLSFASYGSEVGQAYVFSSTRAYMTTADGALVVWNPTTMEIEEDVLLQGLERGGKLGTSITGRDATVAINESARTTGLLNLPIAWSDWTNAAVEPVLAILSISTTDASDQVLAVSDCSAYSLWVMNGRDDNLYVMGSPAWGPFYHHGEGVPSSAVARFLTGTREFDDGYCQSVPELTGGNQGGIALQYGKGQFLLRAIDEDTATASSADTYFGDISSSCSFYQGNIADDGELTLTEAPGMGVDGACFGGFFSVDGAPYFSTPSTDSANFLSRWDGKKLVETIELTGFPQSFERVR